jgi:aryl-alcohol dehydrogenase-like predicted oxidoreductase
MHRDDGDYMEFKEVSREKTRVRSIMTALSDRELSSKYSLIGWSNWESDRVNESIQLGSSNESGLIRPSFSSSYFSLFEMSSRSIHAGGVQVTHQEMMDSNFQKGIMQNPYSPLGGFSILDKPEPRWENAKQAAKAKFEAGDAYWQNVYASIFTNHNEARFKRVEEFTRRFNSEHQTDFSIDQMINAYALAHRRTDFLTVGPVNIEQLRRTVGALKLSRMLTEENLEYLYSGH